MWQSSKTHHSSLPSISPSSPTSPHANSSPRTRSPLPQTIHGAVAHMNCSSKSSCYQLPSMEVPNMPDSDFISSMPDVVPQHILSFLETHKAIQTCILSKRWKNVWSTLPFLSFKGSNNAIPLLKEQVQNLEYFVNMVILRCEPCCLLRFHLNYFVGFGNYEFRDAGTCIHYAVLVMHNVRELHFDVCAHNLVPDCVLTRTSLEKLYLRFRHLFPGDLYQFKDIEVIDLPNLREQVLFGVELDSNFSKQLFSGCPVLEDLHLFDSNHHDCDFSSNKLKHLLVRTCFLSSIGKISASNLISLRFTGQPQVLQVAKYYI